MKKLITTLLTFTTLTTFAQDTAQSNFNLHFQTTYIYQYKPAFGAQYSGTNSLSDAEEKQNSVTATLFLGARLWKGAELYINPEIAGGSGLSGAFGLAASTNGETFRVGDPAPTLYLGRGYIKQTILLSKETNSVADDQNQLGGKEPKRFLRFYLGKFCLGDLLDNNQYAKDPRTQFMNWALMNNAAWDYAANTRGYTYGFATVLQLDKMTYKANIAMLPKVANGPELNSDLGEAYSLNAEATRTYTINHKEGHIRLLAYYNNANMGSYQDALLHRDSTGLPNVIATRKTGRGKTGFGISFDQQLSSTLGIFARAGYNDGNNETWCYTEADQTISIGASLKGDNWNRKDDNIGLAIAHDGLSSIHKDYLAAGGLGFQLGDGKLTYGDETAFELYYSCKPTAAGIWLTADYQFILFPGYNQDRGPVNVFSFRLHVAL